MYSLEPDYSASAGAFGSPSRAELQMSCSSTNANGLDSCNNNTPESAVSIAACTPPNLLDRNDTFF
ncbi:MAG: hypothetical protein ACK55Z_31615 [bacterium]